MTSMRTKIIQRLKLLRRITGEAGIFSVRALRAQHPPILLNTMPKSGSVYIVRTIADMLRLGTMSIGNQYGLIDQINIRYARVLSDGGYVSQDHLSPSAENIQIINHFGMKMVLHLRDPRQALLSWIYHLDLVTNQNDKSDILACLVPRTPPGYFKLSVREKIDWQIDNYLPRLVTWVQQWVEVADQNLVPILITHQDDLRTNEKSLFDKILKFYGLDTQYVLPNVPKTLDETHFRRADPTEWVDTFTSEQALRATSAIPVSLRRRFDWGDSSETPRLSTVGDVGDAVA